jgi:fermentation-respiration switch protein FrsA (DUF1100 family)
MVLQSTFVSVRAMAASMWLPGFLARHPFRNDEVVRALEAPILFMHGDRDDIIPGSHSERLARMAKHGRLVWQPCAHNDFPGDEGAYQRDIEQFLREGGVVR